MKHLTTATLLVCFTFGYGQVILPGSPLEEIIRSQYLDNTETFINNRSVFYPSDSVADDNWIQEGNDLQFVNPELRLYVNSNYNYGYNDGPIWLGKGLTSAAMGGFQWQKKIIHVTIAPVFSLSQNAGFVLAPTLKENKSKFNYQFNRIGDIDYVQRYGEGSFMKVFPGQSELMLKTKRVKFGVATSNFTVGPASTFPLWMSRQGPGIPRIELGTHSFQPLRLKNVDLGEIDAQLTYGLLKESEYFDEDESNDLRFFTSLSLHYLIPGVKSLKIGINRVFYTLEKNFQTRDLLRTITYYNNTDIVPDSANFFTNDLHDQMASVDIEWFIPGSKTRLYVEYLRNDFFADLRDLVVSPEHARAYALGFERKFILNSGNLLVNYEFSNLTRSSTFLKRLAPTMYTHYVVTQGYTNNGQLIGAGIGPGSNAHVFSISQIRENLIAKLSLHRVQFDEDYFYENFTIWPSYIPREGFEDQFSEYSAHLSVTKPIKNFLVSGSLNYSRQLNYYYFGFTDRGNFHSNLMLSYMIK